MAVSTDPIISWWNRTNTAQLTQWDIGVVDAGTESPHLGVLIWNNRGGLTDVANIVEATLTTRDMDAGDVGHVVAGKWIRVRNDSISESVFTAIGKATYHPVRTVGTTVNASGSHTPEVSPHTSPAGTVSALGVKNDGNKTNSPGNIIETTLHAFPAALAPAGTFEFVVRLSYTFT